MESVECIAGFKSSDSYILLGGRIISWAIGASNKTFHAPNRYRGEVKWNSKNLVLKIRMKSEIWGVFKQSNQGRVRRESLHNDNSVNFVTFNNVLVNEVTF